MIRRILVTGGSDVGFLAAVTLKTRLPELEVTVVRCGEPRTLHTPEASTPLLPAHLHGYLGLDVAESLREFEPIWSLGTRLNAWGPRRRFDLTFAPQLDWRWGDLPLLNGFYCFEDFADVNASSALMERGKVFARKDNGEPFIGRDFGYQLEGDRLTSYLDWVGGRCGVKILDGRVESVHPGELGVAEVTLTSGERLSADLYVDCTGPESRLLGEALREPWISFETSIPLDRVLIARWQRPEERIDAHVTVGAMHAGFGWRLEHRGGRSGGCAFSTAFAPEAETVDRVARELPGGEDLHLLTLRPGRRERAWVGNVVALGEASGEVAPLHGARLHLALHACWILAETLADSACDPGPQPVRSYNAFFARAWDQTRAFQAVHFGLASSPDTPFWRACRADVDLGPARPTLEFYRENGPIPSTRIDPLDLGDLYAVEGYLTLLVGLAVPHERLHRPDGRELSAWETHRRHTHERASNGFTVTEAYAAVESPGWRWFPGYFQHEGFLGYFRGEGAFSSAVSRPL